MAAASSHGMTILWDIVLWHNVVTQPGRRVEVDGRSYTLVYGTFVCLLYQMSNMYVSNMAVTHSSSSCVVHHALIRQHQQYSVQCRRNCCYICTAVKCCVF